MQVATLFRESATLLGASMEAGGVNQPEAGGPGSMGPVLGMGMPPHEHASAVAFSQPATNKYKISMKMEPQDDGYETGVDILLSTNNQNSIKCESMEDPYSFIDEEPLSMIQRAQNATHMPCQTTVVPAPNQMTNPLGNAPKKRGRKKKIKSEPGMEFTMGLGCNMKPKVKERKKHDRFNGMPEEEVSKRTLPDHLANNLDIIIIGINPGLFAAYKGHHYAGPGNHFWKCLYLSGLTPEQMTADEDYKLLQVGIGFTNMVQRPTKGSADLTRKEIKEGCQILLEKLQRFKPKIAVFNGKLIYEVFSGKKDFSFGRQPDMVDGTNTYMWVMPSSSARCAQLPRAADKVPFYAALKKFRDYLNGIVTSIDESEVVFSDARLKNCETDIKDSSLYSMELMDISNAVVKKEDGILPCKKKRGRPKKIKVEGEEPSKPTVSKPTQNISNCDFPKKKRGRPKKIKCDDSDLSMSDRNSHTPISKCFSSPSPIQSPTNFYHMNPQMTSPNSGSNMYGGSMTLSHQPYSQSPRPHSQPFTHSDLSSEISAAISSDQLGSPAPTSPSLGPPDFDPPTSMPTDDAIECRFSSPAPSTTSEQPSSATVVQSGPPYSSYPHSFGPEADAHVATTHNYLSPQTPHGQRPASASDYKVEDMSTKSLSGLESLVDQIPNIADGEQMPHNMEAMNADNGEQYSSNMYPNYGTPNRLLSPTSPSRSYSSYTTNGGYSLPSIVSSSNPFSVSNLSSSYRGSSSDGCSSPNSAYTPNMFMDHHQHGMAVGLPPPPPPPTSTFAGYGAGGYTTGANGPYSQPTLHVPSPNYPPPPPPYYNATPYPHPSGAPGMPAPSAYLHNHLFDRIKHPDIGYGSF